ncbi:hypothetical protein [Nonomuraea sp. NPDC049504]|uniref:hypothetical protein n=1 Tax=Nonomuraea sp. NPDC049504 TaxID=3154729 RepID=UPI00343C6A51
MELLRIKGAPNLSEGWWVIAVGAVFLVGSPTLVHLLERDRKRRLKRAAEDPSRQLHDRIREVNTAFTKAAALMHDLQRDLAAQQAAREALIAQAEEQQRLLEIDQGQAERIREILVGETKATIQAERRQQWIFFALGALVSIPIGVAINLLVP